MILCSHHTLLILKASPFTAIDHTVVFLPGLIGLPPIMVAMYAFQLFPLEHQTISLFATITYFILFYFLLGFTSHPSKIW